MRGLKSDRTVSQIQGCCRRLQLQSKKQLRKTGAGKAPVSPSQVSKLVADEIPASAVNHLDQEFDNNAGEELDLRRNKDEREVITCEVLTLKLLAGKEDVGQLKEADLIFGSLTLRMTLL